MRGRDVIARLVPKVWQRQQRRVQGKDRSKEEQEDRRVLQISLKLGWRRGKERIGFQKVFPLTKSGQKTHMCSTCLHVRHMLKFGQNSTMLAA